MSGDKHDKTGFYIALFVIAMILIWWYRSDNGWVKRVKELEDQVCEYEEKIEELQKENDSMREVMEYYDIY